MQDALFATTGKRDTIELDGGGFLRTERFGNRVGRRLISNGFSGTSAISTLCESVRSTAPNLGNKKPETAPMHTRKKGIGALNVPVALGSVLFETGHCIYCDENGVLVSDEPLKI